MTIPEYEIKKNSSDLAVKTELAEFISFLSNKEKYAISMYYSNESKQAVCNTFGIERKRLDALIDQIMQIILKHTNKNPEA